MNRKRRLGVGITALTVLAAGVPASSAMAVPTITASGSTSVAPLFGLLAKGYIKDKNLKGKLRFKLAQGGSDVGVSDVSQGKVSIGNSSRDPKSSDSGVTFNKIAKDAICLATNPANTLQNLTQSQIQAIYSGQVRDWNQIPGATVTGPIDLVVRTPASGTQDAFDKIFMAGTKVSQNAAAKASNGLVQQTIQSDNNAIGYLSFDFVKGTNAVSYAGVACTLPNAKSGQYGGVRSFYMVTRGDPRGSTAKFIKWVQTSPVAQRLIARNWVPLA